MQTITEFIVEYVEEDLYFVFFDWNGNHGNDFFDGNMAFRKEVLAAVLAETDNANLLLVRDLYRAETQFSREAWCIDTRVGRLAQLLLTQGGSAFLEDYLEGRLQSFDAWCAASNAPHTPELGRQMLAEVEHRMATSPDEKQRSLLESGREIFARWAQGTQSS